jgi:hypothetical protein
VTFEFDFDLEGRMLAKLPLEAWEATARCLSLNDQVALQTVSFNLSKLRSTPNFISPKFPSCPSSCFCNEFGQDAEGVQFDELADLDQQRRTLQRLLEEPEFLSIEVQPSVTLGEMVHELLACRHVFGLLKRSGRLRFSLLLDALGSWLSSRLSVLDDVLQSQNTVPSALVALIDGYLPNK